MMYHGFNVNQWGATKRETLSRQDREWERMLVAYIQRILIAVFDSARVLDPGGQDNTMVKVNQNILVQQQQISIHPNKEAYVELLQLVIESSND